MTVRVAVCEAPFCCNASASVLDRHYPRLICAGIASSGGALIFCRRVTLDESSGHGRAEP